MVDVDHVARIASRLDFLDDGPQMLQPGWRQCGRGREERRAPGDREDDRRQKRQPRRHRRKHPIDACGGREQEAGKQERKEARRKWVELRGRQGRREQHGQDNKQRSIAAPRPQCPNSEQHQDSKQPGPAVVQTARQSMHAGAERPKGPRQLLEHPEDVRDARGRPRHEAFGPEPAEVGAIRGADIAHRECGGAERAHAPKRPCDEQRADRAAVSFRQERPSADRRPSRRGRTAPVARTTPLPHRRARGARPASPSRLSDELRPQRRARASQTTRRWSTASPETRNR